MIPFYIKRYDFLKVHALHNFTKYFSGARVNKLVNNCFVFAICYLQDRKKLLLYRKMDEAGNFR